MIFNTPFGLLRLEPLRWLRRAWLWLTAPKSSHHWIWSRVLDRHVQIRSLSDAELWIHAHGAYKGSFIHGREVARRRLPDRAQWLEAAQMMYPDAVGMRIAERVFRP